MKISETVKNLVTNKNFMVIVAVIILAVVVYFLFFTKSAEDKKTEKELEADINDSNQTPTFSDSQYNGFADIIHNSLDNSSISDNKGDAINVLLRMEQTIDVLRLIQSYGKRQRYLFGLPDGEKTNLPQTIIDEISESKILMINQDYNEKGIKYQW